MRKNVIAAAALLFATPAIAQTASQSAAIALADVIAAEAACGLSYDQTAISRWIGDNVAAGDMEFTQTFNGYVTIDTYALGQMTASQKTAHCAQVTRVAQTYGFLRD